MKKFLNEKFFQEVMAINLTKEGFKIVGALDELFRVAERHQELEKLLTSSLEFPDYQSFEEFSRSCARREDEVSSRAEKIIKRLEKLTGAAANTSPFPPLPTSTLQFLWDLKKRDRFYCEPGVYPVPKEKFPAVLEFYLERAADYLTPQTSLRTSGSEIVASLSQIGIVYPEVQDFQGHEISLLDGKKVLMKVRWGSISPRKEVLQLNVYPATYPRLKSPAMLSLYEIINPFISVGKRNRKNWLERTIDGISDRSFEESRLEEDKRAREKR